MRSGLLTFAIGVLVMFGCSGDIGSSHGDSRGPETPSSSGSGGKLGSGAAGPMAPDDVSLPVPASKPTEALTKAAPARVRRLSAVEIDNSIADVFFGGKLPVAGLVRERTEHAFDNEFAKLSVPLSFADDLQRLVESIAPAAAEAAAKLVPCGTSSGAERDCATKLIDLLGRRVFRRPITTAERADLLVTWDAARKLVSATGALATVIESLLQSPQFIFRPELGGAPIAGTNLAPLADFEMAAALSYFLTRSAPDDELLMAAESGLLRSRSALTAQAARLLTTPRGKQAMRDFILQWLELTDATRVVKDAGTLPIYKPELIAAMYRASEMSLDHVLDATDGTLASLLTTSVAFANRDLAAVYGAEAPSSSSAFERVELNPGKRTGLLMQPAFLATHIQGSSFSPVQLGFFVRSKLLCQTLPPPPPDAPPLPEKRAGVSTRQRFAMHSESSACSGCHKLMDPIGFTFENFDPLGRHQTAEAGVALTGAGKVEQTDFDGSYEGAPALVAALAKSGSVATCFGAQVLRYATGRDATDPAARLQSDERAIAALAGLTSAANRPSIRDIMTAAVTTDSFLYRDVSGVPVGGN